MTDVPVSESKQAGRTSEATGTQPPSIAAQAPSTPPRPASRNPLLSLREEMDRLFDDYFSGFALGPFERRLEPTPWRRLQSALGMAYPAVDVQEGETAYRITAELPGMTEKDVEVTLLDGTLTLKGEKREEKEETQEGGRFVSERRYGAFRRSLPLPPGVDPAKVEAELKDGVLAIVLPKTGKAQADAMKIEIKAA